MALLPVGQNGEGDEGGVAVGKEQWRGGSPAVGQGTPAAADEQTARGKLAREQTARENPDQCHRRGTAPRAIALTIAAAFHARSRDLPAKRQ